VVTGKSFSRLITIEGTEMKNDKSLGIPLTQEAVETLKDLQRVKQIGDFIFHHNGKRIYPVKLQRAFRKLCRTAGIANFRFHDCRHSFASYLSQRNVDLYTISKLLGHKDTRMTKRYSHLNVDNLREAVSKLCHVLVTVNETSKSASL
jgi:integrase